MPHLLKQLSHTHRIHSSLRSFHQIEDDGSCNGSLALAAVAAEARGRQKMTLGLNKPPAVDGETMATARGAEEGKKAVDDGEDLSVTRCRCPTARGKQRTAKPPSTATAAPELLQKQRHACGQD
ncbi:unnamed protein product [Urochloa humidicola]